MSKSSNVIGSLFHRFGVAGPARLRAVQGSGAPSSKLSLLFAIVFAFLVLNATPALAARGHVFDKSFSEKGTGNGQLEGPAGIAINEEKDYVYVLDTGNDRIEYFNGTTDAYVGQFNGSATPAESFENPEDIAVDNDPSSPSHGDVYVIDAGHAVIDKFGPEGNYIGQITGTPKGSFARVQEGVPVAGLFSVAVDAAGDLWITALNDGPMPVTELGRVYRFSDQVINEFKGEVTFPYFAVGLEKPGLAVDSEDNLYAQILSFGFVPYIYELNSNGEFNKGEVDHSEIDTEPSSGVAVELPSNDVYIDNVTSVRRFGPGGTPEIERLTFPGAAGGAVGVDGKTGRVYVADPSAGRIEEFGLERPGPPTLGLGASSESVAKVTAESATFGAEINPRSEPSEAPTEYRFEYGPCATPTTCASSPYESSAPVPAGDLAPNYVLDSVTTTVQGLAPHTVYHFRVIVHNGFDPGDPVEGRERTFTTQTSGSAFSLPDDRQWEMVSPTDKYGALIEPITIYGLIQASADGSAMTYIASAPTELEPQGSANASQIFSVRSSDGWSSQDIATRNETESGVTVGDGQEYQAFSSDLSRGLIEPLEFTKFVGEETSPEATQDTPYVRQDFTCQSTPATCFTPLLTETDVTTGVEYGEGPFGYSENHVERPVTNAFEGATPDLSHVVLGVGASLTKATSRTPEAAGSGLYEWSADKPPVEQLQLVSVLPASEGGGPSAGVLGSANGFGDEARNAISNDGSRIIWTVSEGGALYMRDTATEETVNLTLPQLECLVKGTCGSEPADTQFDMASGDGSRVFFTDTQQLTADSRSKDTSGDRIPDLYVCQMVEVEEAGQKKLKCDVTDLSPDTNPDGETADVQGSVLAAGEDGSLVYFVADGVLGDGGEHGATPGNCGPSAASKGSEACNLYVEHYNSETEKWEAPRFIATLSGADANDWAWGSLGAHTSGSSPDGHYLAFMSDRDLTGYDTADAVSGEPDEEVYLYHAEVSSSGQLEPGKLVCASCNPTGARPVGERSEHENMRYVDGYVVWPEGHSLAANIPGWTLYSSKRGAHQPRYLSDSGRLFFNSKDALVPQDVNGTWDVYEYEPPGVGACTSGDLTFGERSGGCVGLISSGESPEESGFLDASESGGDVFFATLSQLVPQDYDHSMDVYDAHECTTESPCFPTPVEVPPPCTTEASCKPSPTPQPTLYAPPASATFSGPGNITPEVAPPPEKVTTKKMVKCRKGLVKNKKGQCVKREKSKKKAKKSSDGRRAR
jgi:hypothetical protein